ncbi:MAG TPA: methyltransferase domain-containing protein [Pirellulales bacterium]|jgi:SAM-dependent methyltransferase|nr:methyltransferase domain-containing protein [Pirellulales bacterium]
MSSNILDALRGAYGCDFKFHQENLLMLGWYARRVAQSFRAAGHSSLMSLGIGHQVVSRALPRELEDRLRRYLIVEGSQAIVDDFVAAAPLPPSTEVVQSWFESFETSEEFDAIEMGFVLEHVDDPREVIQRFRRFVRPGGTLFVAVPNARSLHRRVGQLAGLLDDLYRLSPQDRELGHQRYFDLPMLTGLVSAAGFSVVKSEGIMLKPVTTSQLESLALPPRVIEAFFEVGVAHPDLCNAILLEATH